MYKEVDGKQGN